MSYSFWTKILNGVRGRVPEGNFNAWFKPLKPIRKEGHKVWVLVPNPLFKEWIEKNYRGLFEETARELGYQDFEVEFEDGEDNDLVLVAPEPAKGKGKGADPGEAQERRSKALLQPPVQVRHLRRGPLEPVRLRRLSGRRAESR